MKKIYLVIAGAALILLVITSMLLSLVKKPSTSTQKNSVFPTSIPKPDSANRQVNSQNIQQNNPPSLNAVLLVTSQDINYRNQNLTDLPVDVSIFAPVENSDFKLQFNTQLNKLVIEKKTPEAEQKFNDWAKQNNYPQLISNPDKVLIADPGQSPHNFNPMLDFFSIFMTFGQGAGSSTSDFSTSNPTLTPTITSSLASTSEASSKENKQQSITAFTYYAQCGEQGGIPLPDGGNLCGAGCGPTTVAMISSSYVDKKYDPKTIVGLYDKNNYLLGGDGSRYSDAHELLKSLGLKTTDYLVFNLEKSDTVVPQLKKYLSAGWTFFTLASFCEKGCGHYFWITDIDSKGNIFAYDPAYGRYQIPYNENSRYPYPLYRLAFGVKR